MKTGFIFLGVLILSVLAISGCTDNSGIVKEEGKISAVTTLYPLYEFAREVGGENADVYLLLPPGAEAHTFEPRPSDIIRVSNADVFIYIGAGMEPWAHSIVEGAGNKGLLVLDASSKVSLIKSGEHHHEDEVEDEEQEEHHHGEYDPHIWMDFENDKKIVNAIAEAFSEKDPANREFYFRNAIEYNEKLSALHQEYLSSLSGCRYNVIISAGHNAFSYLAHKYGLEIVSAYGISPDSEPTPQKIKEIIDLINGHGLSHIYSEKLLNPSMAETIASEAKAKTLILNPAHNLLKEEFDKGVTFISG